MKLHNIKRIMGCWIHERWKTELVLRSPEIAKMSRLSWLDLCNRNESLQIDLVTLGRICPWNDSTKLTVSNIFPSTGGRLLTHCLEKFPVRFDRSNDCKTSSNPEVSILLPIGGSDRLPQFQTVLASLRGQKHSAFEIIVVEQSPQPMLKKSLPVDVRYIHTSTDTGKPFNKSWAVNVAARAAKGRKILIHDADFVVPSQYVSECSSALNRVNGVRPSRFNLHLDKKSTNHVTKNYKFPSEISTEYIVQNNPTPVGLTLETFWELGGMDESFSGWGGEDDEFNSRLRTTSFAQGGWMPVIHLWHKQAEKKLVGEQRGNAELYKKRMQQPPERRKQNLRVVQSGQKEGPVTIK